MLTPEFWKPPRKRLTCREPGTAALIGTLLLIAAAIYLVLRIGLGLFLGEAPCLP